MKLKIFGLIFCFVLFFILGKNIYAQTSSPSGLDQLKQEVSQIQSDGQYIAALFYNGFATNGQGFSFSDSQIQTLCGGKCGKIGVNAANFYSQNTTFYERAQGDGMQFSLEIARNDVGGVLAGLQNAHNHGLTPTIRVGVQMDSGGFSNPQDYINFLRSIDSSVDFTVYAIAGSNEPETELWATPNCTLGVPNINASYQCIAAGLTRYMNAIIGGAGNLSHVKLLSPAFNMTDVASPPIVKDMINDGANFGGLVAIAGNAYDIKGKGITEWVSEFMANSGLGNRKIFMTEIGTFDNTALSPTPQPFNIQEVPCTNTIDPEFHSLRPYPASPCYKQITQTALLCANSLVAKNTYHFDSPTGSCVSNGDGSQTCTITKNAQLVGVSIDLANAKLPVLGNTEDVPNATWTSPDTNANNLTPAQRMNNYVSWYLNGVVSNAEQDLSNLDSNNLINFSGPLNKLLPQAISFANKINTIQNAVDTASGSKDLAKDDTARHDQLVGCIGQGNNTLQLIPCYLKAGVNIIQQYLVLGGSNRKRLTNLAGSEPPKESDPKYANNFAGYWKDFLSWLGSTCSPNLGGTQFYLCLTAEFAAITSNNYAARIFPSIPSSTTEDRVGEIFTDKTTVLANGKNDLASTIQTNPTEVTNVSFTATGGRLDPNCADPSKCASHHNLYFSHTQEVAELAKNLQDTFATKSDKSGNDWEAQLQDDVAKNDPDQRATLGSPAQNCEQVQTFTNPGDKLYGDQGQQNGFNDQQITGSLSFDTTFKCKFLPNTSYPACKTTDPNCQPFQPCSHDVFVSMSLFSKTPNVQEDYDRLVNGAMGIFKRFYPKPGNGSPFASASDVKDIPGVTTVSYSAGGGGSDDSVSALAGDPNANRGGDQAQLFFPHLGSIEEYFLRGIQKALRPQGADNAPLEGQAPPMDAGSFGNSSGYFQSLQNTSSTFNSHANFCGLTYVNAQDAEQYASSIKQSLPNQEDFWKRWFSGYLPSQPQILFGNCGGGNCIDFILNTVENTPICNNNTRLNPYVAMAIALNETGGLRNIPGTNHNQNFGCKMASFTTYNDTTPNGLACSVVTANGKKVVNPLLGLSIGSNADGSLACLPNGSSSNRTDIEYDNTVEDGLACMINRFNQYCNANGGNRGDVAALNAYGYSSLENIYGNVMKNLMKDNPGLFSQFANRCGF